MKILFWIGGALLIICVMIAVWKATRGNPFFDPPGKKESLLAASPEPAQDELRAAFVRGLQKMADENGPKSESPVYSVTGDNEDRLTITSNTMDPDLCLRFEESIYAKSAASLGFTKLICRNRNSNAVFTFDLAP